MLLRVPLPASVSGRLRLIVVCLVLAPGLTSLAGLSLFSLHQVREEALSRLATKVQLEKTVLESWVSDRLTLVERLARTPALRSGDMELQRTALLAFMEQQIMFRDAVLTDPGGTTIADATFPVGIDVSDRNYFRQAVQGRASVSGFLTSRQNGETIMIFAAPVYDEAHRFLGVVFGTVLTDTLARFLRGVSNDSSGDSYLLTPDGKHALPAGDHPHDRTHLSSDTPLLAQPNAPGPITGLYENAHGERMLGAGAWVMGGRYAVIAEIPEANTLRSLNQSLGFSLLGALAALLLVTPLVLRLRHSIEIPLMRLRRHAEQVGNGSYELACEESNPSEPEELRQLDSAYCNMVDTVRSTMERLEQASITDPLTGAYNRKHLFSEGARLLAAMLRAGKPVSIIMADLDHFKNVNDTHGHAVGDRLLRHVVHLFSTHLRESDLLARIGGEEFVVLCPNSDREGALLLAERLRTFVESATLPLQDGTLHCTASFGVAEYSPGMGVGVDALERMLESSDKALYAAKRGGRNRVSAWDPEGAAHA